MRVATDTEPKNNWTNKQKKKMLHGRTESTMLGP